MGWKIQHSLVVFDGFHRYQNLDHLKSHVQYLYVQYFGSFTFLERILGNIVTSFN